MVTDLARRSQSRTLTLTLTLTLALALTLAPALTQTLTPTPTLTLTLALTLTLPQVLALPGNNRCADCNASEGLGWASANLALVLCPQCCGGHR